MGKIALTSQTGRISVLERQLNYKNKQVQQKQNKNAKILFL